MSSPNNALSIFKNWKKNTKKNKYFHNFDKGIHRLKIKKKLIFYKLTGGANCSAGYRGWGLEGGPAQIICRYGHWRITGKLRVRAKAREEDQHLLWLSRFRDLCCFRVDGMVWLHVLQLDVRSQLDIRASKSQLDIRFHF